MAAVSTKPYNGPWFSYASKGEIYAASTVLPFLAIVAVVLRIRARFKQKAKIGLDDWLIIPALLMLLTVAVFLLIGTAKHKFGYPTSEAALTASFSLINKLTYFLQLFMIICYGFIKLSVVFFYRRVFIVDNRGVFNYVTWAVVALTISWSLAFLFSFIFTCKTHISAYWGSLEDVEKYCGTGGFALEESFYISDFITDVLIWCLPLPMVWRLNMSIKRKLTVTGIFLLGAMSIAASIARMAMYEEVYKRSFTDLTSSEDLDLTESTILYWSMIECSLALIAACLPTLRIFFVDLSVASIIRSVRSVVSLQSFRSQNTQQSMTGPANLYMELGKTKSISTGHAPFADNSYPSLQLPAMRVDDVLEQANS